MLPRCVCHGFDGPKRQTYIPSGWYDGRMHTVDVGERWGVLPESSPLFIRSRSRLVEYIEVVALTLKEIGPICSTQHVSHVLR